MVIEEKFLRLDGGHDEKYPESQPMREKGETFMQFVKKGAQKIKADSVIMEHLQKSF